MNAGVNWVQKLRWRTSIGLSGMMLAAGWLFREEFHDEYIRIIIYVAGSIGLGLWWFIGVNWERMYHDTDDLIINRRQSLRRVRDPHIHVYTNREPCETCGRPYPFGAEKVE